ncbi:hypothetical protein [Thermococcus sp. 21S7]|uniref:hypothetical protein n=1 Tax=Thermococcus sp. 21S7 TaxID=1638221 RepID=UPI00143903A2|nr:hypothetical protein [Thermococcus sp. 21S7]NJE61475.1 hypothetical protein [Thermococcus sp. 21S7]
MWELLVVAAVSIALAYYVKDVSGKLLARHFELKNEIGTLDERLTRTTSEINKKIRQIESNLASSSLQSETNLSRRIGEIEEKLRAIEKNLTNLKNLETKVEYRFGEISSTLRELQNRVAQVDDQLEGIKDEIKDEVKSEVLEELQDEIEHLEETIERRKNEELEEFLELIKAAVTLQPEKLQEGLAETKKALLSMRDIAKVYVLTGSGTEEFYEVKGSLVELLKNLRKLAVVSVPEESIYSLFNDVIVSVKRLDLPMKVSHNGREKELNPERSFIQIHKLVYATIEKLEEISEMIQEPIPVTPIEKEFYEKLRIQFEELQKLEQQVNELLLRLSPPKGSEKETKERSIEEILEELL